MANDQYTDVGAVELFKKKIKKKTTFHGLK